jgi:hypothetical protein
MFGFVTILVPRYARFRQNYFLINYFAWGLTIVLTNIAH